MTLIKLKIPPGIKRDGSRYSNEGVWWDGNRVRFYNGIPQPIGGWTKYISNALDGHCRAILTWTDLDSKNYLAAGTNTKLYVVNGGVLTDITPIRRTVTLGANPFSVTSGDNTATITDAGHTAVVGDYVTFSGATGGFAGLAAGDLNREFQITTIPTSSTYTVELLVTPNATTTGGGAATVAAYQINVGADSGVISGGGWGAGTWSRGTWSSASAGGSTATGVLRVWSLANYGEDLIASPRNGPIYLWQPSVGGRATLISAIPGANEVPEMCRHVLVTNERFVMAFGCDDLGSSTIDPMLIRWSDEEDYLTWTPDITNAAGGIRLQEGSAIVCVLQTAQEILVWTDTTLYSVKYVGGQFTYGREIVASNIDIVGPLAAAAYGNVVVWLGHTGLWLYDGRVRPIPCAVWDYVFTDINQSQAQKIVATVNMGYNEILIFYCSAASDEVDRYLSYNMQDNTWAFGILDRTIWIDRGIIAYPLAVDADGYIYYQEYGLDDGSTNPPQALNSYIETAPAELHNFVQEMQNASDGGRFMFMTQLLPDVSFFGSTNATPAVVFTFKPQDYPGAAQGTSGTGTVTRTTAESVAVQEFDEVKYVRLRARSIAMRVECNLAGVMWKLGYNRVNVRHDGRK